MHESTVHQAHLDINMGTLTGAQWTTRRLSDLETIFADQNAYAAALHERDDPVIYTVNSLTPADGEGQLHYGIGKLMPGQVGREYYMTKGHFHAWRPAAELYVNLSGSGLMLLQDEQGRSQTAPLEPNTTVYVPGYTAHRTVNTGDTPLVYLGIYPASAGHDYGSIATENFNQVVIELDAQVTVLDRTTYLSMLERNDG